MIQNSSFIISFSAVTVMNMPADAGVPCFKIIMLGAVFKETSCLTHSVAAHQCQLVKMHSKPQYGGVTLLNRKLYLEIKDFDFVCAFVVWRIPW